MSIELVQIDDDRAWHEWYGPVLAVQLDAWPDDPPTGADTLRTLRRSNEYLERIQLVSRAADGQVAGSAEVSFPMTDNRHLAELGVSVAPSHRGHGHGRTLLAAVERLAVERNRTVLIANTFGRSVTADSRDARFAEAAGYRLARREVRRDLVLLPVESERLDALLAANQPAALDYDLVSWWRRCPDHLIAGRIRLAETISSDEPMGDLTTESQVWDEHRVRTWEDSRAELGRELSATGAVERSTGELVAVTEIGMPLPGEEVAIQFMTVVVPEHRGHRLGILTKISNLRQIASHAVPPKRIFTWNAESNREMIRVNAELGFRVAGEGINWQKVLTQ